MSFRVFTHDLNPRVDAHAHKCSNSSAEAVVAEQRGRFVILPDGRRALHLFPPTEFCEILTDSEGKTIYQRVAGSFRDAWSPRPSAGVAVWQMATQ